MNDKTSLATYNKLDNVRKRNIQAVLGLLKMKNESEGDTRGYRVQRNDFERKILKDVYKLTKFPSKQTREDLAILLNHTSRGIQIWFQNQRNARDEKENVKETGSKETSDLPEKAKKTTIDISTLIDILERNMPSDKRDYWESFINHTSEFY